MAERLRSTLEMLEGKKNSGPRHTVATALIAASISLFTASVGLFGEYLIIQPEAERGTAWIFGGFALTFGLAAVCAWWYKKRIDNGVVIDMHLTQLGRADTRSQRWERTTMRSFAGLHRCFTVRRLPSHAGQYDHMRIDVVEPLQQLVAGLEQVLEAHHTDLVRITLEGPVPALFGMGALTYLPGEFRIFEVPDNVKPDKSRIPVDYRERFLEFDTKDYSRIANRLRPRICDRSGPLALAVNGELLDDWHAEQEPDVARVRLALGAVKKDGIDTWKPFEGTPLWYDDSPFVQAGSLRSPSADVSLAGAGRMKSAVFTTPTGDKVRCFQSLDIVQRARNGQKSKASVVEPETVAVFLADVLAWTMARYPNAQIHVVARVPRVIAFMLGAAMATNPYWPAQSTGSEDRTFFADDMASRLKLWGAVDTAKQGGTKVGLALFEVFPDMARLCSDTLLGGDAKTGSQADTVYSGDKIGIDGRLS